ncbi:hypothetical protein KEM55_004500, partial [Ascosphaera atra]
NWHTHNSSTGDTFTDFLTELMHLIGYRLQTTDARREIDKAYQKRHETVTAYHARLTALWIRANSSEDEKIRKFRGFLLPDITNQLLRGSFSSTRDVMAAAKEIEESKKEIGFENQ